MASTESGELHVVVFPWFGFGHISPFVQLSNQLSLHGVKVSLFSAPGNISRIRSTLKLTPMAEIIPIQIPHIEGIPPGFDSTAEMTPAMAERLKLAMDLMQPQIKTILSELNPHFVVYDFAQHWMPKLASQLGIKTLFFHVFSAVSDAWIMVPARKSDHTVDDLMKPPIGFPVTSSIYLKEFEARDFLYVFTRFNDSPTVYERVIEGINGCTAIVFKTCNEMEGPYVDFKRTQFQKTVFLTGPLIPRPPSCELQEKWAKWLGQFPGKSVVYCSFGSESFLSDDQIKELALGLELTGLPFFLVINFPANLDAQNELVRALPGGFSDRVKNRGVVHTGWVQQRLITSHESVGCCISHSGFNSVIEVIVDDCQLVHLPLKGDQFLNSKLIANELKAGIEVKRRGSDGYFGKEDILEAITTVMVEVNKEPGLSIRANHKKLRDFLVNEEIQNKFIADLVKELKVLA
ncbi:Glycosyltransferase [Melia azedarach]|uniref:Glycosyltransferase n=1 Tax=Melia azedarach TaxID=155640 RepID=A0ACC1YZJ8_MELAZ|nr:Glycosyltransferase [Melia azedarach]